jgi:hypothetical protein
MKKTTKIWLGVGAFVVMGGGPVAGGPVNRTSAVTPALTNPIAVLETATAIPRAALQGTVIAQRHGAGEGGENEGGERGASAQLPPDLDFALKIAQMRGHLLVGDELVKQAQSKAAHPHFLHPVEEIYGGIRSKLKDYGVPPFHSALKLLSNAVRDKKSGEEYGKALKTVMDALDAADRGLKAKQANWPSFAVETAIETLKSAAGEYEEAIVKGRIAKPVEYQDARGFILEAERMIESVASALERQDPDALKQVRAGVAELKKILPNAIPPHKPLKDHGALLGDVSRIELAAGKLM